jgi:hypothetical protein
MLKLTPSTVKAKLIAQVAVNDQVSGHPSAPIALIGRPRSARCLSWL